MENTNNNDELSQVSVSLSKKRLEKISIYAIKQSGNLKSRKKLLSKVIEDYIDSLPEQ